LAEYGGGGGSPQAERRAIAARASAAIDGSKFKAVNNRDRKPA
jgi:hypothetical protein